MELLEKYELINKCETAKELADAIIAISNPETNMILGRKKHLMLLKWQKIAIQLLREVFLQTY